VGAETIPHDGRPRGAGKTEPTTFETLTYYGEYEDMKEDRCAIVKRR
jgi:hypothetical protein